MKNFIFTTVVVSLLSMTSWSQTPPKNCFQQWQAAFKARGAYSVADNMHRKVIVSFVEGSDAYCFWGKVRVENGKITSVFVKYEDDTYELYDHKLLNPEKKQPGISNGISEKIIADNGEVLYIVFVETIKPKKKKYQQAPGPGDILN